jgi:hypothetical protein
MSLRFPFLFLGLGVAGLTASAAPLGTSGLNGFLTLDSAINADDNVTLAPKKLDDIWFNVTPGFSVESDSKDPKNAAPVSTALKAGYALNRFATRSRLNSNLLNTDGRLGYDSGKTSVEGTLGFHENSQNTPDMRLTDKLVRNDVFSAKGRAGFAPTEKSRAETSVSYAETRYKDVAFSSNEVTEIPLEIYHEATPKLGLGAGYRYRDTKVKDRALDSTDNFFYLAARGDLLPLLSGKVNVGYGNRQLERAGTHGTFGIDTQLDYKVTEKSVLNVALSNDYGVSGTGESQRNVILSVGGDSRVDATWGAGGKVMYRQINYLKGGADDYFEFEAHANKALTKGVDLKAALIHRRLDGGGVRGLSDFNNTVLSIGASLRY